jgi:hypothetical protein
MTEITKHALEQNAIDELRQATMPEIEAADDALGKLQSGMVAQAGNEFWITVGGRMVDENGDVRSSPHDPRHTWHGPDGLVSARERVGMILERAEKLGVTVEVAIHRRTRFMFTGVVHEIPNTPPSKGNSHA